MPEMNQSYVDYIVSKLRTINPAIVFDHYQEYSAKFGIYYTEPDSEVLTARFAAIGPNKKWETDMTQFMRLADKCLDAIAASMV